MTLKDKTLFISGAAADRFGDRAARRARRCQRRADREDGGPHPRLPGTVFTAAEAIEEAGGHALPIVGDIGDEAQVEAAEAPTVERYGGVDVCVINASAINLAGTEALDMRRYDLMQDVNTRATFVVSAPASRTSSRRRTRTSSRCRR